MIALEMKLQAGPAPTSVCVRMINSSPASLTVAAPDLYRSAWITDNSGEPCPRIRAVKWVHSPKVIQIRPSQAFAAIIDLLHYFDEIRGEVRVRVGLQVTDDSGVPHEQFVEGNVSLQIPSFEKRIAEKKLNPGPRGLPVRFFDVSDSTQFKRLT
jgi:hypothetical protein